MGSVGSWEGDSVLSSSSSSEGVTLGSEDSEVGVGVADSVAVGWRVGTVGFTVFFLVGVAAPPSDLLGIRSGFGNFSISMSTVAFFMYRSQISAGKEPPPMPYEYLPKGVRTSSLPSDPI